jgi:hypothetical protein
VDRFASNTLRTLGIIVVAIFVIVGSLVLGLLALCFGAVANVGGRGHPDPQAQALFFGAIVGAVVLIGGGIMAISAMARGIVRGEPEQSAGQSPAPPYPLVPEPAAESVPSTVAPAAPETASPSSSSPPDPSAFTPAPLSPRSVKLPAARPPAPFSAPPYAAPAAPGVSSFHVATRFSPASRAAIQQLALAITLKIVTEIPIGLAGWMWSRSPMLHGAYRYGFLAWGVAAIAPHLVLLYALLRHPGPRAFAYSIVIPALHIFFGFFGNLATVFALFSRAVPGVHPALMLLSFVPWFLDILILYLAWKAIRRTGIQPNSTRLIVAGTVIFLYTSFLPGVLVLANYFLRPH